MKNKAFTFVELIVAISIMAILGVFGLTYINKFALGNQIQNDISIVKNNIEDLNFKIKNKELFDYQAHFSGKIYFSLITNKNISNPKTSFNLDENTKVFTLKTNLINTGFWFLDIYNSDRFLENIPLYQKNEHSFNLSNHVSYLIKSEIQNFVEEIRIYYFSEDNLFFDEGKLNFIGVYEKPDKTNLLSKDFYLKNINGNVKFFDGIKELNQEEVYIFFEREGIKKFIKISK